MSSNDRFALLLCFVSFGLAGCGGKELTIAPSSTMVDDPTKGNPSGASDGTPNGSSWDDASTLGGDAAASPGDGGVRDASAEAASPKVGVECGAVICAAPAFCRICDPTNPIAARTCETDVQKGCPPPWGEQPPLRVSCDGQEDCPSGERCVLFEGSLGTYVQCMQGGPFSEVVCRAHADCSPTPKSCDPYGTADYPIRVCN